MSVAVVLAAGSAILSVMVLIYLVMYRLKRNLPATSYPRPQGVEIRRANGEIVPVDIAFAGLDDEGCALWRIDTPVKMFEGDTIGVAVLPARTGIEYPVPLPKTGE